MTIQMIHASLDNKLIRNADRYFTASLTQILDEVVQNARRAGARTIRFRLDGTTLHVSDDGRGLSATEAPVLLRLGGSNNTAAIETAENAAGMGFFSMAQYGVTVRSQDWEMIVPKGAFTNAEPARLTTGHETIEGLTLAIPNLDKAGEWSRLYQGMIVTEAVEYSGLRYELTGFGLDNGVHEPKRFLDRDVTDGEVLVREAHGATIKVIRSSEVRTAINLNFYGKVIKLKRLPRQILDKESVCLAVEKKGKLDFSELTIETLVLIDVQDTSRLVLQLPERNEIVENAGLDALMVTITDMQREILRRPGVVNGIGLDHNLRLSDGCDLPLPQIALSAATVTSEDYDSPVAMSQDGEILLADGSRIRPHEAISAHLSDFYVSLLKSPRATTALDGIPLLRKHNMQRAFGKDALSTLTHATLTVRANDEEITVDLGSGNEEFLTVSETIAESDEIVALKSSVVQDIALTLTMEEPEGETTVTASLDAIYYTDCGDAWSPVLLVIPEPKRDIVDAMIEGIDWFDSSCGSKDYEDQEESAREEFNAIYAKIVGKGEEAFVGDVLKAIQDISLRHFGWNNERNRKFIMNIEFDVGPNGFVVKKQSLGEKGGKGKSRTKKRDA